MAKILFLTDSAADIPKSLREELGIRVMPFPIAMGERELRDGEDFTPQEFYQALAEEPKIPTHAQLTAYQFQQCYEETWKAGYTDLIYTSINSEGSATYQNAVQARGEFFEDHPEAGMPSPSGSSTATPIPCATATQWQRGRGWLPQAPLWRRSPPISRTGWIMCGCSLSPLI